MSPRFLRVAGNSLIIIFISPVSVVILVRQPPSFLILSNFTISRSSCPVMRLTRVVFYFISHFKEQAFAVTYSFHCLNFFPVSSISLIFMNFLFLISFVVFPLFS